MRTLLAMILFSTLALASAHAQVTVKNSWVRATVAQQSITGAFMQITSAKGARIVGAKSPVAGRVEMHEMTMKADMMTMREVGAIELPANKAVHLNPGSFHLMLIDLKQPMKAGESIPMTLVVEGVNKKRTAIEIKVPVKPIDFVGGSSASHAH